MFRSSYSSSSQRPAIDGSEASEAVDGKLNERWAEPVSDSVSKPHGRMIHKFDPIGHLPVDAEDDNDEGFNLYT